MQPDATPNISWTTADKLAKQGLADALAND